LDFFQSKHKNLIKTTELKIIAAPLGIEKIEGNSDGAQLKIATKHHLDPLKLIKLIQQKPKKYQLNGQDRLKIIFESSSMEERVAIIEELLQQLAH